MNSAKIAAQGLYDIVLMEFNRGISPQQLVSEPTAAAHLLWMLKQIIDGNLSSETKEHRWLGFVQGILVTKRIISVPEERDRTRGIFNGE